MKYRKKPVVIEAITFDEFIEYGKNNGANIVNGMPWSFKYNGHPVTHENNECYLIPTLEGTHHFTPQDMLITGVKGEIYPCKIDIFVATYEEIEDKVIHKDKIIEATIKIVSQQMSIDEDEITIAENLIDDLGADDLDLIEIAMAIEEEFDILVPDDDFERIYTVKDWVDYITKNIK
jgi:acyl carrier protein